MDKSRMISMIILFTIFFFLGILFLIYKIIFRLLIFVEINDKTISARNIFKKRTYYKWEEDIKHIVKMNDFNGGIFIWGWGVYYVVYLNEKKKRIAFLENEVTLKLMDYIIEKNNIEVIDKSF